MHVGVAAEGSQHFTPIGFGLHVAKQADVAAAVGKKYDIRVPFGEEGRVFMQDVGSKRNTMAEHKDLTFSQR